MKITKKELFKFCDENNDAINELQSQSDSTDFLLAVLIQQLKDSGVIDEISPEPKPQLKQLDQSVFDGEPEQIKWAVVTKEGAVLKFALEPVVSNGLWHWTHRNFCRKHSLIGEYDASNWQNSLIERDIAEELTGSELCKAMLARGDTRIMCIVSDEGSRDDVTHVIRVYEDGRFHTKANSWKYAVPINNHGEPLTSSDVGL